MPKPPSTPPAPPTTPPSPKTKNSPTSPATKASSPKATRKIPPNPDQAPPNAGGRRKQSKALNLLDRFRDHSPSILAFLHDFAVPFDNNQSERDLRMIKVRQKISGTFRSLDALENFCRIRGYVSTVRKNSLTALNALRRIFLGNPFLRTPNSS